MFFCTAVIFLFGRCNDQSVVDYEISFFKQTTLVKDSYVNQQPSWRKDADSVVYTCITDLSHKIYSGVNPSLQYGQEIRLVSVGSKQKETILSEPLGICSPHFSSDGRCVVYCSRVNGAGDIWIHRLSDDSNLRISFQDGEETCPKWAPDGENIAYVSAGRICLYSIKNNTTRIISGISSPVQGLCWSEDGTEIVLSAGSSGETVLYRYLIDKQSLLPMGTRLIYGTDPDFSLVKKPVLVSGYQISFQKDFNVFVYTNSDAKVTKVVSSGTQASWSRDGAQLVFSANGAIILASVWVPVYE
jgi:Tol biopolymer transport system component